MTCETEEVNHEEDKTIVASDGKYEIRITQKKIVKLMTRRVQFELPYEGPSGYYPYLTALFRITSGNFLKLIDLNIPFDRVRSR